MTHEEVLDLLDNELMAEDSTKRVSGVFRFFVVYWLVMVLVAVAAAAAMALCRLIFGWSCERCNRDEPINFHVLNTFTTYTFTTFTQQNYNFFSITVEYGLLLNSKLHLPNVVRKLTLSTRTRAVKQNVFHEHFHIFLPPPVLCLRVDGRVGVREEPPETGGSVGRY